MKEVKAVADDEKLFLDPSSQVIQLDSNTNSRKVAESRKVYHHFCSLNTLGAILESRAIKFNSIGNYDGADEYERKNVAPEFWGQVFVACFTNRPNSNELWNDFGDNGKGVRIDFTFPSVFHEDVFDAKRLVRSFGFDGKEHEELGFAVSTVTHSGFTCNPNRFTQPVVEISLMDVAYTDMPKSSTVFIEGKKALNITSASTEVPFKFWNEYETRVRGILRCTHEVCMSKISYLLVPIKFKYVSIAFGKKVKMEDRQYYSDMLEALKKGEEQEHAIL